MKDNIQFQLQVIQNAMKWIKETPSMKGKKGENAYRNLRDCRRKLNRKKFALESNPAAAVYGESQVGKSYLISSLLSVEGNPFSIIDHNGKVHNFIEEINPPGGGSESTSLVSRFSTTYKPDNPKFPVKAKLLSPADMILVLCDSFYNDIKPVRDLTLQTDAINAELETIKASLQDTPAQQYFLAEDDIMDMQDYFINYLPKANNILNSNFFDEVSFLISKVAPDKWKDIFALLWNKNDFFTALFSKVITEYQKLAFSETVYLPLESILYRNGTLLDVKRLKEIYEQPNRIEPDYKAETTVLCNNREIVLVKSFLCALSAELVFSQPDSLIETKPFLRNTDLLDFPGARSRLTLPQDMIETQIIPELLLRGKVSYLFNKYSDSEKINVLLLCTKHEQAAQRTMPEMLNNWINKIVGDTPEERENFVTKSKIPPLFIIGTFFNVNLQYNPQQDKPNDDSSLNYRWNQRFERTLAKEILNTEIYQWFENWTTSKSNFQNIFLLRDFEKSESISHIFKGFNENKRELEEIVPSQYPDFKNRLRRSFIDYPFVTQHFEKPETSWDMAANINNDGTELIIDKLTIAADNIDAARREKIIHDLKSIKETIIHLLNNYYNSSDKAERLSRAIATAGSIQAILNNAFGHNPYFFGEMMKEMLLSQSEVFDLYHEKINDIERRDVVNMDKYIGIRMFVPELNSNESFEENLEHLCKKYEKQTSQQCRDFFENELHVDLNELFFGSKDRIKNFAQVLVDALATYWFEKNTLEDRQILMEIFPEACFLHDIQDMLHRLFKQLNVREIIAGKIRRYVDGYRNIDDTYEMIADISTEMFNKFINSVGLEYYDETNFKDLETASENINGLSWKHPELQFEQNSREEVAELISQMANLPELLNQDTLPKEAKRLSNCRSYITWCDLLKAGFVTANGIPDYDPKANERLGQIINDCKNINY